MSVEVKITRYTANAVPETAAVDYYVFAITAEFVGQEKWAIRRGGECLSRNGKWHFEPYPSGRTQAWLANHRWTEAEAVERITSIAPDIMVNGNRAGDVAKRSQKQL